MAAGFCSNQSETDQIRSDVLLVILNENLQPHWSSVDMI